ncbi:protein rolling stone-like [Pecten maximus]|uniref:protein rolling stone-like n=1 Tax=Pecten maximus TaxID=6579 RepID=UPI001458C99F|nr:protein rolling stone-like [Pecten maximus]
MADHESGRGGCRQGCSQEFKVSNFLLEYDRPHHFVQFQCGKQIPYLVWRVLWALYHVVWIILTGVYSWQWAGPDPNQQVKWFIYLTDWCYFMLTMSTLLDMGCVVYSRAKRTDICQGLAFTNPWYFKFNWVVFNVANTCSITVSILYWGLLYSSSEVMTAVNIETHALNAVYVIMNLFVTGMPVRILHLWHSMVYALVYVLFSLFYTLGGGTNHVDKNYVYSVLDWKGSTGFTLGISIAVTFVAMPLVHCLCYGMYRLRRVVCCCDDEHVIDTKEVELAYQDNPSYTADTR